MGWWEKLTGKQSAPSQAKTPVLATATPPEGEVVEEVFADQPLRRDWAESVLRAEGVPINPHLPMIESEAQINLRGPEEVAGRLKALCIVAARAGGLDLEETMGFIAEREIGPLLTPREREFLRMRQPDKQSRVQFSWGYEAAWVLFWALQHVDGQLGPPRDVCDVDTMTGTVIDMSDLAERGLRPANEILNEADLIYRYHWAVRQAGIDGKEAPSGLHGGVVMERHHALNWLIGYDENAEWDDVGTDT